MSKTGIKHVIIQRAEGRVNRDNLNPVKVDTIKEASSLLSQWAWTAPKTGGYDKCDFKIEFEDGETYEGRYDLQYDDFWCSHIISKHIEEHCLFYAGLRKPYHMTTEQYESYLNEFGEQQKQDFKDFLNKYDFGQMVEVTNE